jgi:hypothetical protein
LQQRHDPVIPDEPQVARSGFASRISFFPTASGEQQNGSTDAGCWFADGTEPLAQPSCPLGMPGRRFPSG